jgi:hypothetical protein
MRPRPPFRPRLHCYAHACLPALLTAAVVCAAEPSAPTPAGAGAAAAPAQAAAAVVAQALPEVEVRGNYENGLGTADAASAGSATSNLINRRPLLRPGEILEFVPGLIVTQHSGDGKANQYFLRGFNLDHGTDFATFVDGMPVNMRSNAHGQGYTDLNFLIPELVRRVDYRKGPYAAADGDFGSTGSARIGLSDRLDPGLASLTLGAHAYQRMVLAKSHEWGGGNLLYGLELGHNNGPWENPEKFRKFNAMLRYSSGSSADGNSITAMAYQARWNSTDQVPQRAISSGLIARYGAIDASDGGAASRYGIAYNQRCAYADGALRINTWYVQSRLQLFSNFTYALDDPAQGDQLEQAEQRRMLGFEASRVWLGKLGSFDTETTLGVQSRLDRLSPVGLYNTVARTQTTVVRQDDVRELSAGVYLESSVRWLPKLRTVAGLRYDTYRFNVASSIAGNSGRVAASITSPKLSLILGPWARSEFFVNYGEGFHSNDARGTTQTQLPNNGGPTSPVTPLVKTRGAEIGVRSEPLPGLQTSLALWTLWLASELVFVGDAGATQPSRASRRGGIEWSNHYAAGRAGGVEVAVDFDVAFSRAQYTQDDPAGNAIPGAISKVVSTGISIAGRGGWSGALQVRHFGPRPLIEDNSVRSASTTLASLRAAYQLHPRARISVDVFNLLNRKASDIDYFYTSRLAGEAAAGVADVHSHPVEPRSLRATLLLHY